MMGLSGGTAVDAQDLIISADGHVDETEAFWERVPEPLRERARPTYEERPEGVFYTVLGQEMLIPRDVFTGRSDEDRQREFRSDASGGTDLALRRANQTADGVHAEVIFPNDLLANPVHGRWEHKQPKSDQRHGK